MKMKILVAAAGVILMAGCSQQEDPAVQSAAQTSQPAATAVNPTDQPIRNAEKTEDPLLGTQDYVSIRRGSILSAAGPSSTMRELLISGWSAIEPWGVWSEGEHARIGFKIDGVVDSDVEISLMLKGFMTPTKPRLEVVPIANGRKLPAIVLSGDQTNPSSHTIRIPSQDITQSNGRIQIDFDILDPRSPKDSGLSEDTRMLGLGIVEMSVK